MMPVIHVSIRAVQEYDMIYDVSDTNGDSNSTLRAYLALCNITEMLWLMFNVVLFCVIMRKFKLHNFYLTLKIECFKNPFMCIYQINADFWTNKKTLVNNMPFIIINEINACCLIKLEMAIGSNNKITFYVNQ